MQFRTIASGSSGNSYYLGINDQHFLIDAGVSGKRIQHALWELNIRSIDGIFITHEHRDHITGAGVLARRLKTNIYATPLTWRYFLRHGIIGTLEESQIKFIEPGMPVNFGNMEVAAFDISHDASQPVGFTFCVGTEKAAFATDLGQITEDVTKHLKNAKILLLESNHDPEMLAKGSYHASLKARVASSRGHLSNAQAGMVLTEVIKPGFTHVFLAHLSEENNTPMLAFDTVKRVLDENGISPLHMEVAERHIPGELVVYD